MSASHSPGFFVAVIGAGLTACGFLILVRTDDYAARAERDPKAGRRTKSFLRGELTFAKWLAIAGLPVIVVGLIMLAL